MPLKTIELSPTTSFLPLAQAERLGFETPRSALQELYFPLYVHCPPQTPTSSLSSLIHMSSVRESCIAEAAVRMQGWHASDPTSKWIVVVDDADEDEILGGALWHVYDRDPYAGAVSEGGEGQGDVEDHGCVWFPEGEERAVAECLLGQFWRPRMRYMRGPHVFLDILFTVPAARRRGVGRLLMSYGTKLADRHSYNTYIDATNLGRELYQQYGFRAAPQKHEFDVVPLELDQKSERTKEVAEFLTPFEWWPMWRPVGGRWDDGVKAPWEGVGTV